MSPELQAWMKTADADEYLVNNAYKIGFRILHIDPSQPAIGPNLALVWREDVEKLEDALSDARCPQPPSNLMNPPLPKGEPLMTPELKESIKDEAAEKFTKMHKGQACYWLRHGGRFWREVSELTGSSVANAPTLAKNYAKTHNCVWPLPKRSLVKPKGLDRSKTQLPQSKP
jgi:hypothetical protein